MQLTNQPQLQSRYTEAIAATWKYWTEHTESMLPYPNVSANPDIPPVEQANANRQCKTLAEFWQSEIGSDLAAAIRYKVKREIETPEFLAWREDFDRRYSVAK